MVIIRNANKFIKIKDWCDDLNLKTAKALTVGSKDMHTFWLTKFPVVAKFLWFYAPTRHPVKIPCISFFVVLFDLYCYLFKSTCSMLKMLIFGVPLWSSIGPRYLLDLTFTITLWENYVFSCITHNKIEGQGSWVISPTSHGLQAVEPGFGLNSGWSKYYKLDSWEWAVVWKKWAIK